MATQPSENAFGYALTPNRMHSSALATSLVFSHHQPVVQQLIEIPASNIRLLQQCLERSNGSPSSFDDARQKLFQFGGDVLEAWETTLKRRLKPSEREFFRAIEKPHRGRRFKDVAYTQVPVTDVSLHDRSPSTPGQVPICQGANFDRRALFNNSNKCTGPPTAQSSHPRVFQSPRPSQIRTFSASDSAGSSSIKSQAPPKAGQQSENGLIIRVKDVVPDILTDLSLPLARDRLFHRPCTVQLLVEATRGTLRYLYQHSAKGSIRAYRNHHGTCFSLEVPPFEVPSESLEVATQNADDSDEWHRAIAAELNFYIGVTFKGPADYETIIPHVRPGMTRQETRRPATLGAYKRISTTEPMKSHKVALWYHYGEDMPTKHDVLFEPSWGQIRRKTPSRVREVESCPPQLENTTSTRCNAHKSLNVPQRTASFFLSSKLKNDKEVNGSDAGASVADQEPSIKTVHQARRFSDATRSASMGVATKTDDKPAGSKPLPQQHLNTSKDVSSSERPSSGSVSDELEQSHTSLSEGPGRRQSPAGSMRIQVEKLYDAEPTLSLKQEDTGSRSKSVSSPQKPKVPSGQSTPRTNDVNQRRKLSITPLPARTIALPPVIDLLQGELGETSPRQSKTRQRGCSPVSTELQPIVKREVLASALARETILPAGKDFIDLTRDNTPPAATAPARARVGTLPDTAQSTSVAPVTSSKYECKRCGWREDRAWMLIYHYRGRHSLSTSSPWIEELREAAIEERHAPRLVPSIRLQSSLLSPIGTPSPDRRVTKPDPSSTSKDRNNSLTPRKRVRSLSRTKESSLETREQTASLSKMTSTNGPTSAGENRASQASIGPRTADAVAVKVVAPTKNAVPEEGESAAEARPVSRTNSQLLISTPASKTHVSTSIQANSPDKQAICTPRVTSSPASRSHLVSDPTTTPQSTPSGMPLSKASRKSAGARHHAHHSENLKRPAPTPLSPGRRKRRALSPSSSTISSSQENKAPGSTLSLLAPKQRKLPPIAQSTKPTTPAAPPTLPSPLVRHKRKFPVPRPPPGVTFYRTASKRELIPGELLSESDDDVDESALLAEHHALTDTELAHLPHAQRNFMKRFNAHMWTERVTHDGALFGALRRFVGAQGKWMLRKREPRRRLFAAACEKFRVWGALSRAQVGEVLALLDSLGGSEGETDGSSDEEPAIRAARGVKRRGGDPGDDPAWTLVDW